MQRLPLTQSEWKYHLPSFTPGTVVVQSPPSPFCQPVIGTPPLMTGFLARIADVRNRAFSVPESSAVKTTGSSRR